MSKPPIDETENEKIVKKILTNLRILFKKSSEEGQNAVKAILGIDKDKVQSKPLEYGDVKRIWDLFLKDKELPADYNDEIDRLKHERIASFILMDVSKFAHKLEQLKTILTSAELAKVPPVFYKDIGARIPPAVPKHKEKNEKKWNTYFASGRADNTAGKDRKEDKEVGPGKGNEPGKGKKFKQ